MTMFVKFNKDINKNKEKVQNRKLHIHKHTVSFNDVRTK